MPGHALPRDRAGLGAPAPPRRRDDPAIEPAPERLDDGSDDTTDGGTDDDGAAPPQRSGWKRWLGHALGLGLLVAVGWVVVDRARTIDWPAVARALQAYPLVTLVTVLLLVAAAHGVFASYELLARRYVGHRVPARKVLAVGLVSFAFNLNLGSLIGGVGFRWRLYSRLGLKGGQIGRVLAFNLVTNWSGYFALSGLLLAAGLFAPPDELRLPPELTRWAGLLLLLVPGAYLAACAFSRRRTLSVRGHRFQLPAWPLAALQVGLSMLHWSLIGFVINLLLPAELGYAAVLGTLMCAAVAGALVHVPGGLGVIEAVFLASLGGRVAEDQLIAALLAYRAAFYLLPLALATVLHLSLEALAKRRGQSQAAAASPAGSVSSRNAG